MFTHFPSLLKNIRITFLETCTNPYFLNMIGYIEVKRSSGSISRIPGGDRVAVKVGVVQMEKQGIYTGPWWKR